MSTIKPPAAGLTRDEIRRYSRHLIMPEVGVAGQEKLKAARVLMIGAGGLGSPVGLYLAAAGIGTLGLVDFDRVDESNLQRQVLYGQSDIGRPKLDVAVERLREVNPLIDLVPIARRFDISNALELVSGYDVVVDGTDNFPTRYLVNDACVLGGKPNVFGSIFRFEGQVSVFWGARGPCYRCLFPEPPPPGLVPSCAEGGVFGALPGIIGSLQASEVIKLILGAGEPLIGRLLLFDALAMKFRELKLHKSPDCPICGDRPSQSGLIEYEDACAVDEPAGDSAVDFNLSPEELSRRLGEGAPILLLDVRTPQEYAICRLEGSRLLPLQELPRRAEEVPRGAEIAVYCHHGQRSMQAVAYLRQLGIDRARNLVGGINAWSLEIDPSVPRY